MIFVVPNVQNIYQLIRFQEPGDAAESVSDTEEGDTDTLGEDMEISISVPNLSDIITGDNI